ncbi:MAG: hypothetical protein LHV68_01280 [Elusimicrobia bacterium]|nr:hypothetical protein [Candidatus Liberimonas magnetica]
MKRKIVLILLGIFLSITLLEIGLRLSGYTYLYLQEYGNRKALNNKGTYRILCLGESTTAGQYPQYLEEELNNRHIV